jgi:hypothetical protein
MQVFFLNRSNFFRPTHGKGVFLGRLDEENGPGVPVSSIRIRYNKAAASNLVDAAAGVPASGHLES